MTEGKLENQIADQPSQQAKEARHWGRQSTYRGALNDCVTRIGDLRAAGPAWDCRSDASANTGHPVIASFEPDEDWLWSYTTGDMIEGSELVAPRSHPRSQPVPGPRGHVPRDWQDKLN